MSQSLRRLSSPFTCGHWRAHWHASDYISVCHSRRHLLLHKCANPDCPSVFRRLSQGKLFVIETDNSTAACGITSANRRARSVRRLERYWLCDCCSSLLTVSVERGRGVVTVPIHPGNTHVPALHLRSIPPAMKPFGVQPELKGVL